jgi:N-acetylglucosamine-6-phosphate deacetylase
MSTNETKWTRDGRYIRDGEGQLLATFARAEDAAKAVAAPEMYEALRYLAKVTSAHITGKSGHPLATAVADAWAALAQAEEREP